MLYFPEPVFIPPSIISNFNELGLTADIKWTQNSISVFVPAGYDGNYRNTLYLTPQQCLEKETQILDPIYATAEATS